MRVLIACEESQRVTTAFRELGIEAFSCDILPTSGNYPEWHIQSDISDIMNDDWKAIIAFPPCTHLANSGRRWFKQKREDGRQQEGIEFFMKFVKSDCPFVAIENPIGIMSTLYRKPDQIIQPYWFGEPFQKSTCLWLKGFPKLIATNIVEKGEFRHTTTGKVMSKWYWETSLYPTKNGERAKQRSKTFEGVARAMAEQWIPILRDDNRGLDLTT